MPENVSDTSTKSISSVHNRENYNEVETFFCRADIAGTTLNT